MKYKVQIYNIWEVGQRKDAQGNPHQEDNIYPAYGMQKDTDRLFILCDGMGGHDAGEVASATVCDAMSKSVLSQKDVDLNFSDKMLQDAIDAAFDALDKKDTGALKKMGTTMTFLKLHDNGATIAHMGDSRVYQIRQGETKEGTKIIFETQDHSLVNDMVKIGELTPEEAKHSKQKNIITRAMQPNMESRPKADVYHTTDIQPGDYFYMCSDGMLEEMDDDNLCYFFSKAAGDDEQRVKRLKQATIDNRDNHSAIIVHIIDVEGSAFAPPRETDNIEMGSNVGEISDSTDNENAEMVSLDDEPSLTDATNISTVPPQTPTPPSCKKKKVPKLLIAAVGIVVILAVAFTIKQFCTSETKEVKEEIPLKVHSARTKPKQPITKSKPLKNPSFSEESSTPAKPVKSGTLTPSNGHAPAQAAQGQNGNAASTQPVNAQQPVQTQVSNPSVNTPSDLQDVKHHGKDNNDVIVSDKNKLKEVVKKTK